MNRVDNQTKPIKREHTVIARWESARGKFFLELTFERHYGFKIEASNFNKYIMAGSRIEAIVQAKEHLFLVDIGKNKNPIQRTI